MTTSWPTEARLLIDLAGSRWGGLWSLLYTAERAVGALGQVVSFAEGTDLMWLGTELSVAGEGNGAIRPKSASSGCVDRRADALDLGK